MLGEAEATLAAMDRFRRRAQEIKNLAAGHLHLITTASLARGFLPEVTQDFRRRAPEVTLKIMASSVEHNAEIPMVSEIATISSALIPFGQRVPLFSLRGQSSF